MDPITVSMGLGLFAAGGGLGWWLSKTHESLDGLGDGMILLQEAQASTSAMMGKRMDGLEERVQRLVAGLDGVRSAHPAASPGCSDHTWPDPNGRSVLTPKPHPRPR